MKDINVEVLAPVGSYKMLDEVLASKCDAIYLGGIEFNMRMHSKILNFTNDEIKDSVDKAHKLKKQVYVTVNTWFDNFDSEMMKDYLIFLDQCNVDAIIVQDYGVIEIVKQLNLDLEIHSSVMMNIHSIEQINVVKKLGVTRVVLSREMTLDQVSEIAKQTDIELEYFVSGDMCSANGGICYFSGILFGKSANQGQCFKMCRWNYDLVYNNKIYDDSYYLAAKDMDMVNHVDKLIDSGVNSLKIEGRRKQTKDTIDIINSFALAKEDYLNNTKNHYNLDYIYPRETSTAYALNKPGLSYINTKNEGNPNALRIFSKYGKEISISENKLNHAKEYINEKIKDNTITVKVDNYQDAKLALKLNVDKVYISIEQFKEEFKLEDMQDIINSKGNTKIYLSMPTMRSKKADKYTNELISNLNNLDGIEASDIAHIVEYSKDYEVRCNYMLGCMNDYSAKFLTDLGASSSCISIEAKPKQFNDLLNPNKDVYVYGRLMYMYIDLDLYENLDNLKPLGDTESTFKDTLILRNKLNEEHPIFRDQFNKNHLMSTKILNIIPVCNQGNMIIDKRFINEDELKYAIKLINNEVEQETRENEYLGSLNHGYTGRKYVIEK